MSRGETLLVFWMWFVRALLLLTIAQGFYSLKYPGRIRYLFLRIFRDVDESVVPEEHRFYHWIYSFFAIAACSIMLFFTFVLDAVH